MAVTREQDSGPAPSRLRDAEVLETAARIFHERGYASSSVQLIADELGILKGSLYYYTQSKEQLLYRLLKGVHDDLAEILHEVKAASAAPLERLYTYVFRQVQYATKNTVRIAIYYRDADQLTDEHQAVINAERREHILFLRDLIKEGQKAGVMVADENPTVLSDLIFGSFIWTYRWYNRAGKLSPDKIAAAAARFAVRAVEPDRAASGS